MDVNQIFKDLGVLVHEQGEMIGKHTGVRFTKKTLFELYVILLTVIF